MGLVLTIEFYTYLVVLLIAIAIGLFCYNNFDAPIKLIFFLLIITFISESVTIVTTRYINDKDSVYHFYSIIEIIITTLYFLQRLRLNHSKAIMWIASTVWLLMGIINMYFQPLNTLNSNMLLAESITIIGMSLYSLYKILLDERITSVMTYSHFWIWTCFLLYQCSTFFFWAFFDDLILHQTKYKFALLAIQGLVNIVVYCGIGLSFLLFSKVKSA